VSYITKGNTKTWKEFRNAGLVHKGYIPSNSETIAYGNIVYLHLNELISDLKARSGAESVCKQPHFTMSQEEIKLLMAKWSLLVSTMSIPTLVSLARGEDPPESFEKALESISEYRKWLHDV